MARSSSPSRRCAGPWLALGIALAACAALCACRSPAPPAPREVLRLLLPSSVSTLDPHVANTTAAFTLLGNVYEPLIHADPGLGLRPGLARSWYNPDPLTWDFDLQPDVTFHSGRPFEAKDAAYSIARVLASPDLEIGYYLGDVASAEALGPHSLRVHLRRRSAAMLNKLGHVFIVPAGSTRESLAARADGTGPYRVREWQPGQRAELEARTDDRRVRPPVARVSVRIDVPPADIVAELRAHRADMGLVGPRREAETLEGFDRHRRGSLQVKYLGFDVSPLAPACCRGRANPFLDRRVRRAIHLALDRTALVTSLPSHATPANQLVPHHVFGFNAALPETRTDRDEARRLLREAGLSQGLSATLHTRQILAEGARLVQSQLREVGIQLEVAALPDPEYFAGLKRREFVLWLDRWSCTTGDAGELFENALHTPEPRRGLGGFNESGFSSPELDRGTEKMLVLEDLPSRRRALEDLMATVMDELVWVPLYTDDEVWAVDRAFVWRPGSDYWLHLADVAPVATGSR